MEDVLIQSFDHLASEYDHNYTLSAVNIMQRRQVRFYLEKKVLNREKLDILEINCGTGEDANYLGKLGHRVLATDLSFEMINISRQKILKSDSVNVIFKQAAFADIHHWNREQKFDLVFSNFGGLNCISHFEFKLLLSDIHELLKNDGRFIGVIMPKFCLHEMLYFMYKLNWKSMFRRNHKGCVLLNLDGHEFKTWYYSPRDIKKLNISFHLNRIVPVGIALPPACLDNFFRKRPQLLKFLNIIESRINRISLLAGISDHFLFDLKK